MSDGGALEQEQEQEDAEPPLWLPPAAAAAQHQQAADEPPDPAASPRHAPPSPFQSVKPGWEPQHGGASLEAPSAGGSGQARAASLPPRPGSSSRLAPNGSRPSSAASVRSINRPGSAASNRSQSGAREGRPASPDLGMAHSGAVGSGRVHTLSLRLSRGGGTSEGGSQTSVTLESVMSQLHMASDGTGECRTLLPGLDLLEHGLGDLDLQAHGGDLPVVTAPRGINLRVAITQALSTHGLESSSSAPRSGVHPLASVPGTPATLPCGLGSPSGTPLVPAPLLAVPWGAGIRDEQQERQQQQQGEQQGGPEAALTASADHQPAHSQSAAEESTSWQWLLQGRFGPGGAAKQGSGGAASAQPALGVAPPHSLPPPPRQLADLRASSSIREASAAAEVGAGQQQQQGAEQQQDLAAQQQQQGQAGWAPAGGQEQGGAQVRLTGARPWTYDGSVGQGTSLGAPRSSKPTQTDIELRARLAARLWPMMAPFVPRLLRQYVAQARPAVGDGEESSIYQSMARALSCKASAKPQALSRAMRPAMESFPAAVMIADVSGFTALTEALGGQGSAGVELLTKGMNRYFTQVIDLLLLYGGDVEKFAGDCMIVIFPPTNQEAEGSEDGGLAAAALRAATCGAELTARFGAMRMLPNGEVVPLPAEERWGGTTAEEEQAGVHSRQDSFQDGLGSRLVSRGASAAMLPVRVAARAASTSAKAAGAAAGGGARVTVAALGAGVGMAGAAGAAGVAVGAAGVAAGAAGVAALATTPHRLFRGQRGTKSEMHLSGSGRALERAESMSGAASRASSGMLSGRLMRTHSSPDTSLQPPEDAAGWGGQDASASSQQASPTRRGPMRSLFRQSSSVASAVLSRLSRGSSPRFGSRGGTPRASLARTSAGAVLEGAEGLAANGAAEGQQGAAAAAAAGASEPASAEATPSPAQLRQQRERRLQEQALAELVVLAGPAGRTRPPDLPSASAAAEAAAARMARRTSQAQPLPGSMTPGRLSFAAVGAAGGLGNAGGTVGPGLSRGRVLRTETAPAAVANAMHQAAMESAGHSSSSLFSSPRTSFGLVAGSPRSPARHSQARFMPPLVSGISFAEEEEEEQEQEGATEGTEPRAEQSAGAVGAPDAGRSQQQSQEEPLSPSRSELPPGRQPSSSQLEAGQHGASYNLGGSDGAEAAGLPRRAPSSGTSQQPGSARRSMLQRLLSTAGMPWRGRTVSSSGGGADSSLGCQSSGVSILSEPAAAPWNVSLVELSTELGLPGSITSQGTLSPRRASRQFGRPTTQQQQPSTGGQRSHHRRNSSGGWFAQALQRSSVGHLRSPGGTVDASVSPQPGSPGRHAFSSEASFGFPGAAPGGGEGGASGSPDGGGQDVQALASNTLQRVVLSLKVLLAAGTVCAFHVGGNLETSADDATSVPRWEFFIGDTPQPEAAEEGEERPRPPIAQLQEAERHAVSGHAVLSPEVAAMLGPKCSLEPLPGGNARLLELREPYQLPPEVQAEAQTSSIERSAKQISRERAALRALPEVAQGHAMQVMRMHLLENVRGRVESGHIDYVNELRGTATVVFLGFPFLLEPPPKSGPGAARTGLAAVQSCMDVLQKRMRQYDGTLLQFRCDEKGFLAICGFGLPGRTHEDGPGRGVQAALAIVEAIKRRGGRACCGVTTGQLFCAMVGSQRRSEYTVFGSSVNLSARLMVRARDQEAEVYCDATTQQLARHKAVYQRLDPVRVKGRQGPVEVFLVTSLHAESSDGQHPFQSPLGPRLLAQPPAAGEAAAAAAGLTLRRSFVNGSSAVDTHAPGSSSAEAQASAAPAAEAAGGAGLRDLATALAADLVEPQDGQQGQAGQAGGPQEAQGQAAAGAIVPLSLPPQPPPRAAHQAPMIGRDEELAAITQRCVELVSERRGGLVMLQGEAGMGKSRMVEELQHSELGGVFDSCNLFIGLGRKENDSQALYPWRRVLREMFHHDAQLGQLYCFRGSNPPLVATELAVRLQAEVSDYALWRHLLADALAVGDEELPPAVPSLEDHLRDLMRQGAYEAELATPAALKLQPEVQARLAAGSKKAELLAELGEEDEEFLTAANRAKSFALRMKRAKSINMGPYFKALASGSVPAPTIEAVRDMARSATPSPRKLAELEQRQREALWEHARAEAEARTGGALSPSFSASSSQGSSGGASPYGSSPASSSAGSEHSLSGMPSGLDEGWEESGRRHMSPHGGRPGRGRTLHSPVMQRSATSRGAGLRARSGSPVREISAHLRVRKIQELVLAIFRLFTDAYGPLVLVLEDVHHFDTASWRLLSSAVSDEGLRRSVLFVATFRPNFGALAPALRQRGGSREMLHKMVQAAYSSVMALPTTLHLVLQPFDVEQSRVFVSAALGGIPVPDDVAALLYERSGGLPSFLEQLVVFLQMFVHKELERHTSEDEGGAGNRPRRRSTVQEVQAVAQLGLDFIRQNVSINSIITDRVGRLRPEEQLMLKLASVLGNYVYRQLLQAIHPQRPPLAAVEASLGVLEAANFLARDSAEPHIWRFCGGMARDVVYDLLPVDTRRDWHAAAAAAMEAYSSDHTLLPPSTIAWHWGLSCSGVEAPQWQRSFRAVHWWELAACDSLESGAHAEARSVLQKAQDVAAALERYFQDHSRSFVLMRDAQQAAAQQAGGAGGPPLLEGQPTGQSAITLADSNVSTRGTASVLAGQASSAEPALPMIPRLRRAHWERCMAAMCLAADLTPESVYDAKIHCLRALHYLGVPLPFSEEFAEWELAEAQRWWRPGRLLTQLGCASPGGCRKAAEDPFQLRLAGLQAESFQYLAPPDSLIMHRQAGTGERPASGRPISRAGLLRRPKSASAAAAPGEVQWQQALGPGGSTVSTFGVSPSLLLPASGGAAGFGQPLSAGPGGLGVVGGMSLWGVPNCPADSLSLPPPGLAPGAAGPLPNGAGQQHQQPGRPSLLQPSPFEAQPAGSAGGGAADAGLPAATSSLPPAARSSGAQQTSGILGCPPAAGSGVGSGSQTQPASSSVQLQRSGTPSTLQYRAWQAAGLAAAEAAAEQEPEQQPSEGGAAGVGGGQLSSLSRAAGGDAAALQVQPQDSGVQRVQEQLRRQEVAFGLSGTDERYSPGAKSEAAVVLDLLCSLLLAVPPRMADAQGLRYVRWACAHLQGGPVGRSSPYWQTYHDCGLALQMISRSPQRPAQQAQQAQRSASATAASPSPQRPLARRSLQAVPQTLANMAGAVAGAAAQTGRPHSQSTDSGAPAGGQAALAAGA